jgi:hypothetical protein
VQVYLGFGGWTSLNLAVFRRGLEAFNLFLDEVFMWLFGGALSSEGELASSPSSLD